MVVAFISSSLPFAAAAVLCLVLHSPRLLPAGFPFEYIVLVRCSASFWVVFV